MSNFLFEIKDSQKITCISVTYSDLSDLCYPNV